MVQDIRSTVQAFLALQAGGSETSPDLMALVVRLAAMNPAIVYIYDLKSHRSVFLNGRIFETLGLMQEQAEEAGSDLLARRMHPNDRQQMVAMVQQFDAVNDTDAIGALFRLRHASGEWRWISSRCVVFLRDADGRPLQILGTAEEMAEPTHTEEVHPEQEASSRQFSERLQAVLSLSNDLSRLETMDDLYRIAVERGRKDLGFDRLGLWLADGRNWIQGTWGTDEHGNLRDERDKRLFVMTVPELVQAVRGEVRVLASDDQELFDHESEPVGFGWNIRAGLWDGLQMIGHLSADNLLSGRPRTEQDSELIRIFAIHLGHLCTRKRMEASLREDEARFHALVEGLPNLIWILDPNNVTILVNRAWSEFTGCSPEDAAGFDWIATIHPDDRDGAVESFLEARAARRHYHAEYRVRDRLGQYRLLQTTAVPRIDQEGAFAGYLGSGLDVTEQKILREQLFESQKLESMGRLAGGIAHDFNNLLTAILGYTELSMALIPPQSEVRSFLDNVRAAGERAAELTKQLLMYARRQMVEFTVVDINGVVLNMNLLLRRSIGEQYELVTVLADDDCCVSANVSQMEQVLTNLVVNARDAMPEGGRILVETSCVFLDRESVEQHAGLAPGEYVLYSVSDSGMGMTEEVRNRIFEPFYTTKEVGKGTGLGLATCYGIVKQSKGNIWVHSEKDKGTTFKVYLPRVREAAQNSPARLPDNLPAGTETILLVDDEPMVRDIAARSLRAQGYRVLEASNGVEALHRQGEYPGEIDLLVSDVVMPLMGGKELARHLQQLYPTVKLLYMSGYTQDVVLQQGIIKPGVALLTKPFTAADLCEKVRQVLSDE